MIVGWLVLGHWSIACIFWWNFPSIQILGSKQNRVGKKQFHQALPMKGDAEKDIAENQSSRASGPVVQNKTVVQDRTGVHGETAEFSAALETSSSAGEQIRVLFILQEVPAGTSRPER
ncbi:MAG: hypothetical protein CMJ72_02075 [Planctomycetaceae bacterium]|nr:hypothetical protein [Planctomycetaceae bacterium]